MGGKAGEAEGGVEGRAGLSFWLYSLFALLASSVFLIWRAPKIGSFWRSFYIFVIAQIMYLCWQTFLIFWTMENAGQGDPQLAAGWIAKYILGSITYCLIAIITLGLVYLILKYLYRKREF